MKRALVSIVLLALVSACSTVRGTRALVGSACTPTTFVQGYRIFTVTAGCDTIPTGSIIPPAPQGTGA